MSARRIKWALVVKWGFIGSVGVLCAGVRAAANAYAHPNAAGWISAAVVGFFIGLGFAWFGWRAATVVVRFVQENRKVDRLTADVRRPSPHRRRTEPKPDLDVDGVLGVVRRDPGCDVRRSTTWDDRDRGGRRSGRADNVRHDYFAPNAGDRYFTCGDFR